MAKVAKPSSVPSASLQIGGGVIKVGPMVKRKTPSELRGEQLKQMNPVESVDESPAPLLGSNNEVNNGPKKAEPPRNQTRVDELYPAKKSRFRMLSGKESAKGLKNLSLLSTLAAKRRHEFSGPENAVNSTEVAKDDALQARQTNEKVSQGTFRSVTELSKGDDRSSGFATVDMNKALQGLAAPESSDTNGLPASSFEKCIDHTFSNLGNFCIPGQKTPLDFTLKTSMRVLSSSPVS